MYRHLKLALICSFVAVMLIGLVACGGGGGGDDSADRFAGKLEGTDAFVFVLHDGDRFNAYVCDGKNEKASLVEWFSGTVGNSGAISGTSGNGVSLSAVIAGDSSVAGTVTFKNGEIHNFLIPPVTGEFGLYRGVLKEANGTLEGGWILLPDGSQRGAVRQIIDGTSNTLVSTQGITTTTTSLRFGSSLLPINQALNAYLIV